MKLKRDLELRFGLCLKTIKEPLSLICMALAKPYYVGFIRGFFQFEISLASDSTAQRWRMDFTSNKVNSLIHIISLVRASCF